MSNQGPCTTCLAPVGKGSLVPWKMDMEETTFDVKCYSWFFCTFEHIRVFPSGQETGSVCVCVGGAPSQELQRDSSDVETTGNLVCGKCNPFPAGPFCDSFRRNWCLVLWNPIQSTTSRCTWFRVESPVTLGARLPGWSDGQLAHIDVGFFYGTDQKSCDFCQVPLDCEVWLAAVACRVCNSVKPHPGAILFSRLSTEFCVTLRSSALVCIAEKRTHFCVSRHFIRESRDTNGGSWERWFWSKFISFNNIDTEGVVGRGNSKARD